MKHFNLAAALAAAFVIGPASVGPLPAQAPADAAPALPASAEHAYAAVLERFDAAAAVDVVEFMSQSWRVAGNPGFNASIDHLRERLTAVGFGDGPGDRAGTLRVDEFPTVTPGWDYTVGTVAIDAESPEVVLSRERDRVSLCINSFSTRDGGLLAPLVDVGAATDADFADKELRGAVVLGDASIGRLWLQAVKARGAAGVISTAIAPYIRPADSAAFTSEEQKDVLQWGSVPYDPGVRAFGFKASWRAASRLRERLREGPVRLRVDIQSSFHDGPNRSLVAEIPGRSRPDERTVLIAHVQEPGANDDASGCATLYGLARALAEAIRSGALPPPERTLTFMWVDETRGTRQWLSSRPAEARGVQYMLALDMTGEDTGRTGGTFLIEKQPDPSAVWPRPSDPHSEWGASQVKPETLKGSLLNDLHLAVCLRRARDTGWVVRTNPYEGGSDHTPFVAAGIPALLNWHFTDRYYHTNLDTPDKVSAGELRNVGVSVATTAWLLASAGERDAAAVVDLLEPAAARRFALEREQGRQLVESAADRKAAEAIERQVMEAWRKWYGEALDSVLRLPVSGETTGLRERVAAAKARLGIQP
ncbi:MAG TPA: M28 family peptidase [Vicinamibacterales bacterium]|nr:M28 family peptidase [Vicinamibacterales bacterium]